MRFYENIQKTSENREAPRSYYIPSGKSEYTLLNGTWRFHYFARDTELTRNITEWDEIPVPSCWQIYGYENPNYTNVNYPYPCDPPYVPDDNPCGVYERDITIDSVWGKVYFVLEGVASCATVIVNGREVGFTEGSHLQAEFDITEYVKKGLNTIRVEVRKWCCGSYLEDQDCFRFNGIFRDCYLLQRPIDHIKNVKVISRDGKITVDCEKKADVSLYTMDGELIFKSANTENAVFEIDKPMFWNAEHPYLYTVKLEREGEIIEVKTAFRTIEISDKRELLINGVSVKLRGVNHHDTHPTKGWCQTNEELRRDLSLMKELNINCVRTSHYPPTPAFVDMCDEMGFYVVLETDIETHGILRRLPNVPYRYDVESSDWVCVKPEWKGEFVERMKRAATPHFNHPSVIMWSVGNESGYGPNQEAMIDWLKTLDDSRLAHCEDAGRKGDDTKVDIHSRMYLSPADLTVLAKDTEKCSLPVFQCEYSHAMGNGPGDVYEYNELFDKYPALIGGCIWEWADHTVIVDGVQKYGGDFEGELTSDSNFCCDGMVFSDRSFKAGTYEIKEAFAPIVSEYEDGILKIRNRYDFTDLCECEITYSVEVDGTEVDKKVLDIKAAPHETVEIPLELPCPECKYGAYINITMTRGGFEYARAQHPIPCTIISDNQERAYAAYTENEHEIVFSGEGFEYIYSKHYGTFTSIKTDGKERIADKPNITAWHAPTDNDAKIKLYWGSYNIWQGDNLDKAFTKTYSVDFDGKTAVASCSLAGVSRKPVSLHTIKTEVFADGRIEFHVDASIRADAKWLPRYGFEFTLPTESREFSYFGMGPEECYADMCHHTRIGRYESSAEREYVSYVRPQEHGNHIKTKELLIGGLKFRAIERDFEFNVSKYKANDLARAAHTDELCEDGLVHVRVDYKVSGLGSNSCGPELDPKYKLSEKNISFAFSLSPERKA